jgi:pimeloyl-ACP methyl ester carboxylesterase
LTITIIATSISTLYAQTLAGDWEGHIDVMGQKLRIITHFTTTSAGVEGTIDIPQQGATGLTLQDIAVSKQDSVSFAFFAGSGIAKFQGSFQNDSMIAGDFLQNGRTFPFQLQKQQVTSEAAQYSNRELPYHQDKMVIKNDSIDIGGTLTWPQKEQTDRLVIMISGSGAQDRDETMKPLSNFKPFAVLADSLTMDGLATFRYDDRGVGQSTGNFGNTTLDMLASDVEVIIDSLTNHPDHQFSEIILLGHSQGGIVAGKVVNQHSGIDKIVLMASTGVPLLEVIHFQVRQQFQEAGIDSATIQKERKARNQFIEAIIKGTGTAEAKKEYLDIFRSIQLSAGADSAQASQLVKQQARALPQTFGSPQMKSLLYHDPAQDLAEIDIPVLVLFGGKDTQVTVEMNKGPIKKALESAGVDYEIITFDDANHPFQKAKTGKWQEYSTLENKFVDGFTSTIIDWIKNQK